jgi:two-component system, sensor histidine kinase LadS
MAQITSETLQEIRAISQDLRPSSLDAIGLTASVQNMMERLKKTTAIDLEFDCKKSIDEILEKDMEINIYRILQELLSNIIKHSHATHALVLVKKQTKELSLTVSDNGMGFDTKYALATGGGNGLSAINEHVKILKGNILYNLEPKGMKIIVKIPLVP